MNSGSPAFNDSFGLEWFSLLTDYDKAGAVTINTNRDLDMFKRGRVGIIIDGSWNISTLAEAIGQENLAIDPWPSYGTGYMSGWVESDSVFLNANTTGNDRYAALAFIGYFLDPNVQDAPGRSRAYTLCFNQHYQGMVLSARQWSIFTWCTLSNSQLMRASLNNIGTSLIRQSRRYF